MARTNIEKAPEEALKKLEQEVKDIEARKVKILEEIKAPLEHPPLMPPTSVGGSDGSHLYLIIYKAPRTATRTHGVLSGT